MKRQNARAAAALTLAATTLPPNAANDTTQYDKNATARQDIGLVGDGLAGEQMTLSTGATPIRAIVELIPGISVLPIAISSCSVPLPIQSALPDLRDTIMLKFVFLILLAVAGLLSSGQSHAAIDCSTDTYECKGQIYGAWSYNWGQGFDACRDLPAHGLYFESSGEAVSRMRAQLVCGYYPYATEFRQGAVPPAVTAPDGNCAGTNDYTVCTTGGKNYYELGAYSEFRYYLDAQTGWSSWGGVARLRAGRDHTCPSGYPLYEYDLSSGVWVCARYSTITVPVKSEKNVGPCEVCAGNPINLSTGSKFDVVVDGFVGSRFPIEIRRYYDSQYDDTTNSLGWSESGIGHHWRLGMAARLDVRNVDPYMVAVTVRPDGKRFSFKRVNGAWAPVTADIFDRLEDVFDGSSVLIGRVLRVAASRNVEHYDLSGRLASIENAQGDRQDFSYDLRNRLTTVADDQGRFITIAYLQQDQGGSPADEFPGAPESGRTDQIRTISDSSGHSWVYSYDDVTKVLSSVTYPDAAKVVYHYENANDPRLLTGMSDVSATNVTTRYATYAYDSVGRAVSTEHAGGAGHVDITYVSVNETKATRWINGVASAVTTTYSMTTSLGVNKLANVVNPCGACGIVQSRTYDAAGQSDISTDFRGAITDTNFDANGLLTQVIRGKNTSEQQTETRFWDVTLRVPTQIERSGQTQTFTYNARGQALTASVAVTNPPPGQGPRTNTMTYCEAAGVTAGSCPRVGLLLSVDGPRTDVSDVTTYTYYPSDDASCATAPTTCPHRKGDLWKVTNAAGQVSEVLAYDGAGRVLSSKDPNGVVTDREYQSRGWLTAQKVRGLNNASEADDAITSLTYDGVGQVTRVTQPDGAFTAFTYDPAHRLTTIADSLGNSVTYTLDNAGNRIEEKTKTAGGTLKRSLARVYNGLGRMQTLADALATPTDFTYDLNGNVDTVKDALNRISDNDYDALDRLKTSIVNATGVAPDKATTQFQYDARDNLTTVIDPKGLSTIYGYNGLDDLKTLTSPDTGVTSYDYDTAGNRTGQVDARGKATTYGYDVLNRLTSQSVPTSAQNVGFAYDTPPADCQAGETFGTGRLAVITDESGTTRYCYNRLGQLVRKVQAVTGGPVLTVGSTYTGADRLVAMTYPSGAIVTYLRDANGQITGISAKPTASAAQVTLVSGATYLPFGPLNTMTFGNGRVVTKAYDQNYGIDKVSDAATGGISEDFTLNVVGNVTGLVERTTATANTTRAFTYDGQDRLTALKNGTTVVQGFTYDATGNRLSKNLSGTITTNTIDPASHRLTQTGTTVLTYDANGNQTKNGTPAFVYDDRNRLRDYKSNGTALTRTYRYNGKGERVSKTVAARNTNNRYYTYDESGHLLGEYLASGVRVQEYVWMDDSLVAVLSDHDATTYQYVQTDHLGTPRAVINPVSNTIIWRWNLTNTAFGEHAPTADPDGNSISYTFNMRYPGQSYDAESKLHYNYSRYFDAATGRYTQSDFIGLAGGNSTYGYVGSSPLAGIDPLGLKQVFWFNEDDHNFLKEAMQFADDLNSCLVYAHGSDRSVKKFYKEGALGNGKALALALIAAGCTPGQPVFLYSCNTGKGDDSIAQELSNTEIEINGRKVRPFTRVTAPTRYIGYTDEPAVNVGRHGPTTIVGRTYFEDGRDPVPNYSDVGYMREFVDGRPLTSP